MKKFIAFIFFVIFNFLNLSYSATLDEKISQMIIVGFDGNNVSSKGFKSIIRDINDVSGVILFNKNIKDVKELNKMTILLKEKSKIPPLISIDNEGG